VNWYFSNIKKVTSFILIFLFVALPTAPVFSAELTSSSYTIQEYEVGSGDEMNSTNYSVTGNLNQVHTGIFSVSNLPLAPGVITSCGKITTPGTYILGSNLIGISGTCFSVQANDVTIDGDGYTVIASNSNSSYAVTATSSVSADSAYGTTTISNITFSGFGGGVNASGNNATGGNTNGGNGGNVVVSNSSMGAILTSAGLGFGSGVVGNGARVEVTDSTTGNITNSGTGGVILLSGNNLNISNNIYTASGAFSVSYTGTLTTTNTTLSAVSNFSVQGTNYGSFIGGGFPLYPSTITSCGSLYFAGTYTLGTNVTGNCNILGPGVVIEGDGNTLTGNISANNHGVTLSNLTVTGSVSTTGAGAGALVVNNASNLIGTVSVTGSISGDGSSSLGNTTISAGGSVATSSVSFVGDVTNNGTIHPGISVLGKITNNSVINTGGGTFSFNATSTNSGTVNGNALFAASSTNVGTVTGDATFAAYTSTAGVVTFGGTTAFAGTGYVNGTLYDSTGTQEITTWVFTASSTNTGVLAGDVEFNDTSRNVLGGIIVGNTVFRNSSANLGTITGQVDVYAPVVRPLGGIINGQVIYHEYDGLYFNDTAPGHGVVGKWDDINNWWIDAAATIPSPIIPTEGDDVIILSGTISTTIAPAHVRSAIFQNASVNAITLTVESDERDAALFNSFSANDGTIIGNATFAGADSENNGTVTGYITRQYSTGIFTVVSDFTHNGVNWIVQAVNGATVDLTGATYSLLTNIFEALSNSVFIFNTLIGGSTPSLTVTSPTSGTNTKWQPIVSWSGNTLCQYKMDNGLYMSVSCANNGSDIPRPTAGAHTLFLRATDAQGNATEKTVTFTYDNTQPIDTDCSTSLDEATRPYYYLTSNVGNCSVTASTTLRGDDGSGNYFSVGNITGSSTNIVLENVTATGTVSGFTSLTVASSTISATTTISGALYADTLSRFSNGIINSGATVYGGVFTGSVTNNGTIINSTTTPVTVAGSTFNNGAITGDFIFNASSTNSGVVNGDLTLNGSSYNQGVVNGNIIFNTLTADAGIVTISGNTVFRGTGTTTGDLIDNRGDNILIWNFEDSSVNIGRTKGTAYFHDSSSNLGIVQGDGHFNDASTNAGVVTGDAHRYKAWLIAHELGGVVQGSTQYHSYPNSVSFRNNSGTNDWNTLTNWFRFAATTTPLGRLPQSGEDIVLFASTTLVSNLTNDIYIGASTTTISGAGFTVNGVISGNGAYGGFPGYDFNLSRITVTGTTTAMGGDGNPSIDGGKGGNIRVEYSTTNVIVVNGGDPLHNGGDAGTIYAFNSIGVLTQTSIKAVGGDSIGCGFGGSGGNVTLVNTAQYIVFVEPGRNATSTVAQGGGCENPLSGSGGSRGQSVVTGTFNPSLINNAPGGDDPSVNTPSRPSATKISESILDRFLPIVDFNLNLSPLNLIPLPTFGSGEDSFSFIDKIKNFFSTPIPQEIYSQYSNIPNLFTVFGLTTLNDLMELRGKGKIIEDTKIPGLFTVYIKTDIAPLTTYLTFDPTEFLSQTVRARIGQELVITVSGTQSALRPVFRFNGEEIEYSDKIELTIPTRAGVYVLTSSETPIPLKIHVTEDGMSDIFSIRENKVSFFTIIGTSTRDMIEYVSGSILDVFNFFHELVKNFFKEVLLFLKSLR